MLWVSREGAKACRGVRRVEGQKGSPLDPGNGGWNSLYLVSPPSVQMLSSMAGDSGGTRECMSCSLLLGTASLHFPESFGITKILTVPEYGRIFPPRS